MVSTQTFIQKFFRKLPGDEWKKHLKRFYINYHLGLWTTELAQVPIAHSDSEFIGSCRTPFVVLENGTILYGKWPNDFERTLFSYWKKSIKPTITEDTIRVAMDVVLRYQYPHAMPQLTMPYSRRARKCFHSQHIETIEDLPGISMVQKNKLKVIYQPKQGGLFLDIGAYMGYGAIRVSKDLGPTGSIIAVEANPDTLWLLEHNLRCNNLANVTIVPKAIWNKEDETLEFTKSERQANSLVKDIINKPSQYVSVKTTTIDTLLNSIEVKDVDPLISITVNGAEVEAIEGMKEFQGNYKHIRLSIAGWYKRDGQRICDIIFPTLKSYDLNVKVGQKGSIFAWR